MENEPILAAEEVVAADPMRLEEPLCRRAVLGAVLIGGASRRMGFPKHLAVVGGETMLERVLSVVDPWVDRSVVVGAGRLPDGAKDVDRVVDDPGCGAGPLAGLLTALRYAPRACWLVVACDMPEVKGRAVRWLLQQRAPGRRAVIPRNSNGRVEPLFAVYEPQARDLLEDLRARGELTPGVLAELSCVHSPSIPPTLRACWTNVNRPEELDRARDREY